VAQTLTVTSCAHHRVIVSVSLLRATVRAYMQTLTLRNLFAGMSLYLLPRVTVLFLRVTVRAYMQTLTLDVF